ncbi:substrate-binding domain-containing protein [Agrobacterium rosae]|uniref:Transcriptional regulator LacI/GalR-like sensor domain-containing protein n=1 Tax=Agrobacterium rosae TaxID=1972867 RepID=A0AAE5RVC8_9HYPH|nr:LacI family transcriptional regulator [Agrobacterium rosae]KAA3524265.1 LacI family transcriptional regulator [Agrobacterium rosae]MCM2431157.1 LacI family transcriptional regulator [Agrobacterium rosae]MQB46606.1 LacI family transcriptional regulator [Agrobacterium rosae]POO49939.1 hypothetical protein CPJ18_16165 [Agrobacterium rosae]
MELLTGNIQPSAIIASDSLIALEISKVARELSVETPAALTLLTFHDAAWSAVTSPPVRVIRQPVNEPGEAAAHMLIERLHGEKCPAHHAILPTQLIERGSIATLDLLIQVLSFYRERFRLSLVRAEVPRFPYHPSQRSIG